MASVGPQTRGGGQGQARAGALWDRACAKSGVRMGEVGGVHRVAARLWRSWGPPGCGVHRHASAFGGTAAQPGVAEARDWIYCCDCYGCRCCSASSGGVSLVQMAWDGWRLCASAADRCTHVRRRHALVSPGTVPHPVSGHAVNPSMRLVGACMPPMAPPWLRRHTPAILPVDRQAVAAARSRVCHVWIGVETPMQAEAFGADNHQRQTNTDKSADHDACAVQAVLRTRSRAGNRSMHGAAHAARCACPTPRPTLRTPVQGRCPGGCGSSPCFTDVWVPPGCSYRPCRSGPGSPSANRSGAAKRAI
ncbi:hypothetical protein DB817_10445 [Xanthomonas perforans]|nr:hypothetical protein DB795_21780 [Xanthomonas perforans]RXE15382.1 hypothetical protein DB817_10445 [Xanthomonas perforans]RXE35685.1 hypothetical protein DB843_19240 [Xanthomonas perforans]RXE37041.1 hypothetical protein DB834_14690 [Xanthomonas perforans]TQT96874.1 hypothetical protein DB777_18350 [Xanthomonas perforans]